MAYKPAGKQFAIVFEERQVQTVEVDLSVNLSSLVLNDAAPTAGIYKTDANVCKVVIQDPYLDGLAWATLDEANDLLSRKGTQGVLEGNLLPKCGPTESPATHKCNRYAVIDASVTGIDPDSKETLGLVKEGRAGFAYPLVIITLWYKLNGINQTIEQTFYYRVTASNITHGASGEPTLSLTGKGVYHLTFQQNLQPVFFKKGDSLVDQLNGENFDIKKNGYRVEDVCSTPADSVKIERNYRINNLTTEEVLSKFVNSFEDGGQVLSLPTREFANKIQLCSKQDSSCYFQRVFYLGKGLYESYTIDNQFPDGSLIRNYRFGEPTEGGSADQLASAEKFNLFVPDPLVTKQKLSVTTNNSFLPYEKQFEKLDDYITGVSSNGWKANIEMNREDAGTMTVEKVEKIALFGDAKGPTAPLGGKVLASTETSVTIESPFYMHYCISNGAICGRSNVYQEFRKLKNVSVKQDDALAINQTIGEMEYEGQDKSKFRFYIQIGRDKNIKTVTLDPTQVKTAISTEESRTDQDKKDDAPTDGGEKNIGDKIGEIGNTGSSSGPHAHIEFEDKRPITEAQARKYINISGSTTVTSRYRTEKRPDHNGIDIAAAEGTPVFVRGGAKILDADRGVKDPKGFGYNVKIDTPEGTMIIAHLKAGSIPQDVPNIGGGKEGSIEKTQSKAGEASTSGPSNKSLPKVGILVRTEFKGVPKALSILPGRTILSFVTDYNDWIKGGKTNSIEPGVWIPDSYKNWPVTKTKFKWEQGDLRVSLEARRHYRIDAQAPIDAAIPKFNEYKVEKGYTDYYDYIRSSGDLCYGDSCTKCGGYSGATQSAGFVGAQASDITTKYPPGKFTYTCDKYNKANIQAIADAANHLGITNKFAIAGIMGNALQESLVNPAAVGDGGNSLGIFQWNTSRKKALEAHAAEVKGDPTSINTQMSWFVKEVKQSYSGMIAALNNSTSVNNATQIFEDTYEKAGTPQMERRFAYAQEIFNCLS